MGLITSITLSTSRRFLVSQRSALDLAEPERPDVGTGP
jgi:hypothetical protein